MPTEQPLKPLERSIFTKLAHLILSLWAKMQRAWFRWAELNQHSAWFPVFIALIVGFDAMVVVLPGDAVVALATLSNPKGWRRLALWSGLGGALGAFALYMLLHVYGKAPLDEVNRQLVSLGAGPAIQDVAELDVPPPPPKKESGFRAHIQKLKKNPRWQSARDFFDKYGLFSLALGSIVPFFSWPPVVLAGLSSDKWFQVLFFLLLGRQVRYWILCFGLREGWAMFTTLRKEAREQKEHREQQRIGGG